MSGACCAARFAVSACRTISASSDSGLICGCLVRRYGPGVGAGHAARRKRLLDLYLLQFWPAPLTPDAVIRETPASGRPTGTPKPAHAIATHSAGAALLERRCFFKHLEEIESGIVASRLHLPPQLLSSTLRDRIRKQFLPRPPQHPCKSRYSIFRRGSPHNCTECAHRCFAQGYSSVSLQIYCE